MSSAPAGLPGTWSLVSITHYFADGRIQHSFTEGDGVLVLDAAGHFTQVLIRGDLPAFASGNRDTPTPEESLALSRGSLTFFGTYAVDQAGEILTFRIRRSSFPNWNGQHQARRITTLTDTDLRIVAAAATVGARGEQIWRRLG